MAISKDLGPVSGYAVAVEHGYTGTEQEWIELILSTTKNAQRAAEQRQGADAAAGRAEGSAHSAADSASEAQASAGSAEEDAAAAAQNAQAAADSATASAQNAQAAEGSASAADQSAQRAAASEANAGASAAEAGQSATSAQTAAQAAEEAASGADESQRLAGLSRDDARTAQEAAQRSAQNATAQAERAEAALEQIVLPTQELVEHVAGDYLTDINTAVNLHTITLRNLTDAVAVEQHTVNLTNTDKYPFNNSAQTIALDERRNTLDYSVEAEVLSHVGTVGDVVIYDKQTNGFKVKFEGSGKSATVLLKITGGN